METERDGRFDPFIAETKQRCTAPGVLLEGSRLQSDVGALWGTTFEEGWGVQKCWGGFRSFSSMCLMMS